MAEHTTRVDAGLLGRGFSRAVTRRFQTCELVVYSIVPVRIDARRGGGLEEGMMKGKRAGHGRDARSVPAAPARRAVAEAVAEDGEIGRRDARP